LSLASCLYPLRSSAIWSPSVVRQYQQAHDVPVSTSVARHAPPLLVTMSRTEVGPGGGDSRRRAWIRVRLDLATLPVSPKM
jgi:hypothetical protein